MNEVIRLWNRNFDKGITIFQMFLGLFMIIGYVIGSEFLILFSMLNFLFGYFEPNQNRYCLNRGLIDNE